MSYWGNLNANVLSTTISLAIRIVFLPILLLFILYLLVHSFIHWIERHMFRIVYLSNLKKKKRKFHPGVVFSAVLARREEHIHPLNLRSAV